MKRLIIDFDRDGTQYTYKMYHPLIDPSQGYVTYSTTPISFISDISKQIQEYLPNVPSLEEAEANKLVPYEKGWFLIHQSKLASYEETIKYLNALINSLEEELDKLKNTNK